MPHPEAVSYKHLDVYKRQVASRLDSEDRVREALKLALERGLPVLEATRMELDRLTDGAIHQGLALAVPPYAYADPRDLIDPELPGVPLVVALDGITDPRNLGAVSYTHLDVYKRQVPAPRHRLVRPARTAYRPAVIATPAARLCTRDPSPV